MDTGDPEAETPLPSDAVPFADLGLVAGEGVPGTTFLAYRTRSGALHLLPLDVAKRRAFLAHLTPHGLRGKVLKRFMIHGIRPVARLQLDAICLDGLARCLDGGQGSVSSILGLYLGTPSAYRKLTATLADRQGVVSAVARIPLDALSEGAVNTEAATLRRLETVPALKGMVPRVLRTATWKGRTASILSAGPIGSATRKLSSAHLQFLGKLHQGTTKVTRLQETLMWKRWTTEIPAFRSRLPARWRALLDRAIPRLEQALGDSPIPVATAHRDFAPWNCRIVGTRIFVFDWEMASDESIPLYDAIHFHAVQAALRGGPLRLSKAVTILLSRIWPAGSQMMGDLILAYLIDTGFSYAKASTLCPGTGSQKLLDWFGGRLEQSLATLILP